MLSTVAIAVLLFVSKHLMYEPPLFFFPDN